MSMKKDAILFYWSTPQRNLHKELNYVKNKKYSNNVFKSDRVKNKKIFIFYQPNLYSFAASDWIKQIRLFNNERIGLVFINPKPACSYVSVIDNKVGILYLLLNKRNKQKAYVNSPTSLFSKLYTKYQIQKDPWDAILKFVNPTLSTLQQKLLDIITTDQLNESHIEDVRNNPVIFENLHVPVEQLDQFRENMNMCYRDNYSCKKSVMTLIDNEQRLEVPNVMNIFHKLDPYKYPYPNQNNDDLKSIKITPNQTEFVGFCCICLEQEPRPLWIRMFDLKYEYGRRIPLDEMSNETAISHNQVCIKCHQEYPEETSEESYGNGEHVVPLILDENIHIHIYNLFKKYARDTSSTRNLVIISWIFWSTESLPNRFEWCKFIAERTYISSNLSKPEYPITFMQYIQDSHMKLKELCGYDLCFGIMVMALKIKFYPKSKKLAEKIINYFLVKSIIDWEDEEDMTSMIETINKIIPQINIISADDYSEVYYDSSSDESDEDNKSDKKTYRKILKKLKKYKN